MTFDRSSVPSESRKTTPAAVPRQQNLPGCHGEIQRRHEPQRPATDAAAQDSTMTIEQPDDLLSQSSRARVSLSRPAMVDRGARSGRGHCIAQPSRIASRSSQLGSCWGSLRASPLHLALALFGSAELFNSSVVVRRKQATCLMRAMKTAGLPTGDGYPRPSPPSEPHVITDKESAIASSPASSTNHDKGRAWTRANKHGRLMPTPFLASNLGHPARG